MPTDHNEKSANQPVANAATLLNDNIGITVSGGLLWLFGVYLFWYSDPPADNRALILSLGLSSVLVGWLLGYRAPVRGQVFRMSLGVGSRVAGFWFFGAAFVEYFATDFTATATVGVFPGLLIATSVIVVVTFLSAYLVSQARERSWKLNDILSILALLLALATSIFTVYSLQLNKEDKPTSPPEESSSESNG